MVKIESGRKLFLKDNREYYDEFSHIYEKERNYGYHRLIDTLESDLAKRYCRNKVVLEAGCGTGLIMNSLKEQTRFCIGVDISKNMLNLSQKKGLTVILSNLLNLPFKNEVFDVVYSFKVLPHIENITQVLEELSRVNKSNGYLLVEFYNRKSLRYLVRCLSKRKAISERSTDRDVFTRYDVYKEMKSYLPKGYRVEHTRGIRIFSPNAFVFKIPLISSLFRGIEQLFCDSLLKFFGGFFIFVLKKE